MEKMLPLPINEKGRLQQLKDYGILDTLPEKEYDNITKLASNICGTEIALISLIDEDRQWFKSKVGLDAEQTSREISFCQYAIMDDKLFEVENAMEDPQFKDNPLVLGDPNIRHYAGIPLKTPTGHNIGTLCVIDSRPGNLSPEQIESLEALADQVISLLELRMTTKMLLQSKTQNDNFFELSLDLLCVASIDGYFKKLSPSFENILGFTENDLLSKPFADYIHPNDVEPTMNEIKKLGEGAKTIDFVNRFKTKDNNYKWFSWRAAPDADTGLLYAIARDVTDSFLLQRSNEAELEAINNSVIRMVLSPQGKILEVNKQLSELMGYEIEELINEHHSVLFYQEDKNSEDYVKFWENLKNGIPQSAQSRRKGKNNDEVWIKGTYIPVKDLEGKVSKVIKIAYDTTEQIKAENSLKGERQRLDYVIRGTNLGTWEWNVQTGETVFNERWAEIIGYTLEELAPISIDTWMKYAHSGDLEGSGKALEQHFNGEKDFYSFESRMKHKDGHWVWVYDRGKVVSWTGDGQPLWMYGTHQEITERKEKEKKITELARTQEAILNGTNHSIVFTDPNGIIKKINHGAELMLGYKSEELVDKQSPAIFHVEEEIVERANVVSEKLGRKIKPGFESFVAIAKELNIADVNEFTYIHKSGKKLPALLSVTCIRDHNDNITGYLGVATDITIQKQQFLEIQRKNKELDQFSYIVSHDLKAPLRGIASLTTFLEEDLEGKLSDQTLEYLDLLKHRVKSLEYLVNDILEYSKIGRSNVEKERVDSLSLINEIVSSLEYPENTEIIIAENLPILNIQRVLLYQVFSNLISNAIKYADKPKIRIEINFDILPDKIILRVIDNGPGIDPRYHERIFQVFQTIDKKQRPDSTGIGLSTVKKIIDEWYGNITLESEVGKGSKFNITLGKEFLIDE